MMVAGLYDGNIAVYNLQKNTGQFSIKYLFCTFLYLLIFFLHLVVISKCVSKKLEGRKLFKSKQKIYQPEKEKLKKYFTIFCVILMFFQTFFSAPYFVNHLSHSKICIFPTYIFDFQNLVC